MESSAPAQAGRRERWTDRQEAREREAFASQQPPSQADSSAKEDGSYECRRVGERREARSGPGLKRSEREELRASLCLDKLVRTRYRSGGEVVAGVASRSEAVAVCEISVVIV